ncbi:acyl-CoA dehydrogenase [Xanthomonas prunicola]|uniref:Acyl-CoA dehydrogenase n=1 Tax=Xanthomonas prunicola TaxID=2053930 RepID=A0A2N3RK59_9XANT|nr:acyl-CoA dehydrogenase [Xanthomonas prunicola]PKV17171.1 acyl-CoA dehydrogenase [Xanthomonas prunicola]PKV21074.1 acyl-CoA dehydrogenase [Xanthomonas prunicola]
MWVGAPGTKCSQTCLAAVGQRWACCITTAVSQPAGETARQIKRTEQRHD